MNEELWLWWSHFTHVWFLFFSFWLLTRCLFLLGEGPAFDEEWRREAGRYAPPNARGLDYGRDRRGGGQQLALTAPPSSTSPPGHRHESPRHRQPQTRPRYDWWEGKRDVRDHCATIIIIAVICCELINFWMLSDIKLNGHILLL